MRSSGKINLDIDFDDNFVENIERALEDSFNESCKKWKVKLNTETHDKIMKHAVGQLESKVSALSGSKWSLSKSITIKIPHHEDVNVKLPGKIHPHLSDIMLLKVRSTGWQVDTEGNEESISLEDFEQYLENCIEQWVKTAVFYGVGSYANC